MAEERDLGSNILCAKALVQCRARQRAGTPTLIAARTVQGQGLIAGTGTRFRQAG